MMTIAPEGRRLLYAETRNAQTPIEEKSDWIRTIAAVGEDYVDMKSLVSTSSLYTVRQETQRPNIYECWQGREATFLTGGSECTRYCDFCRVAIGRPKSLNHNKSQRIAEPVCHLGLYYVTITGVTHDNLPDGTSRVYAEMCRQTRELCPGTGVELLVDDSQGGIEMLHQVFDSHPEVFIHNLEAVPQIFKRIRPAFRYGRSLGIIAMASEGGLVAKSNLILDMGEIREGVEEAMATLCRNSCDLLTVTQYLRPPPLHHPTDRWVKPKGFIELRDLDRKMGLTGVMTGPLMRSSYHAGRLYGVAVTVGGPELPPDMEHLGEPMEVRQEVGWPLSKGRGC